MSMTEDAIDPKKHHWSVTRELEPRLIGHFLAVVDNHTISRAAEVLNLTQPALSKSIKQLEERLGVVLFERWPTGVKLTAYGEVLARRGRLIQRELSHAVTELHSMKGGASGIIKIGAGLVWTQNYLPPLITKFLSARPGMQVELQSGVIDTLVPRLVSGDLDLICTTLDFPDTSDIVKEPLVDVVHTIYARAGHPLFSNKEVSPQDLANWGWITLKGDYVGHNRLGSFFAANGMEPPIVRMELAPDLSILSMIAHSDHLCNLPVAFKDIAANQGVVPIKMANSQLWSSTAGMAYRRTDYPAPAVNTLLTMIRANFQT
jgi:LysR family transcriptional regulator of gallate degradation